MPIVQDMTITLTPEPEVEIDRMSGVPAGETEKKDNRPTVLVVEDNPDISFYISTLLKNKYNLYYASNGKEGIDKAKSCMPDLILTDLMMSGMDGYVLCQEIRQSEILKQIPTIIITEISEVTDRIDGVN